MSTKRTHQQGFTLLELLMVVIIVGILASLALPGYIRAAERARAAEVVTILGQLKGSAQRFCLAEDGTAPTAFAQLDIEDPTNPATALGQSFSGRWTMAFPAVACNPFSFNTLVTRAGAGPCAGSTVTMVHPVVPPAQEITYAWIGACG